MKLSLHFGIPPARYSEIKEVMDSDNKGLFAHQRYSADVIEIRYGGSGYFCISHEDKQAAIDILKKRCPPAIFKTERRH